MNILVSFAIPLCRAVGSISLHLEHSFAAFYRLVMNGSFASMTNMISYFCRTRSSMNEINLSNC